MGIKSIFELGGVPNFIWKLKAPAPGNICYPCIAVRPKDTEIGGGCHPIHQDGEGKYFDFLNIIRLKELLIQYFKSLTIVSAKADGKYH